MNGAIFQHIETNRKRRHHLQWRYASPAQPWDRQPEEWLQLLSSGNVGPDMRFNMTLRWHRSHKEGCTLRAADGAADTGDGRRERLCYNTPQSIVQTRIGYFNSQGQEVRREPDQRPVMYLQEKRSWVSHPDSAQVKAPEALRQRVLVAGQASSSSEQLPVRGIIQVPEVDPWKGDTVGSVMKTTHGIDYDLPLPSWEIDEPSVQKYLQHEPLPPWRRETHSSQEVQTEVTGQELLDMNERQKRQEEVMECLLSLLPTWEALRNEAKLTLLCPSDKVQLDLMILTNGRNRIQPMSSFSLLRAGL